jgi:hypothetical protein
MTKKPTGREPAGHGWRAKQNAPATLPEAIRDMIETVLDILSKDPGEKVAEKAKRK